MDHADYLYLEDPEPEEEKFDSQNLLVGNPSKTKFWQLYKSPRKFKDHHEGRPTEKDPRFAYFEMCKEMNINPRANQLIREKESPIIDFTNEYLNSSTSVKAIAESIKLMAF
jgi:hypothetical protein